MEQDIIAVEGLSHRFGKELVLDGISFSVPRGAILGVLGPSGSGKTTLIRCLAGLLAQSEGKASVLGRPAGSSGLSRRIGYMAQMDALYGDLSAAQNLDYFASLYGMDRKARKARMEAVFALTRLQGHENKRVRLFSGGMKKRLSLAVALLHEPEVLFLDEPTVGIDPLLRAEFWAEFRALAASGRTLVISTHVMDEAERCTELALLFDGELLSRGTPAAVMAAARAQSVEDAFLTLRASRPDVAEKVMK